MNVSKISVERKRESNPIDKFAPPPLSFPTSEDIRELMPDPFPYEDYVTYLNTPQVQSAIGAYVNYSESSNVVVETFATTGDDGRESLTIQDIRKLLAAKVTVTLWAGDADYNCNWLGGEAVAKIINHQGYNQAGYTDIKTVDGITVSEFVGRDIDLN